MVKTIYLDYEYVFGYEVWVTKIPALDILEARCRCVIMVDYCGEGYRIQDLHENKVIILGDYSTTEHAIKTVGENEEREIEDEK